MKHTVIDFENLSFRRNIYERQSHLRADSEFLKSSLDSDETGFILFCDENPFFTKNENIYNVKIFTHHEIIDWQNLNTPPLFAGIMNGQVIFLLNYKKSSAEFISTHLGGEFLNLRQSLWQMQVEYLEILGFGASIFGWHRNHGYCAKCGAKTVAQDMGYKRFCEECNSEHFPRIDPVAIMLVIHKDKCLVGRTKLFPPSLYSVLAGFVEPCETIEQACRREVMEEVGLKIGKVEYLSNQPWPFISQLMFGLIAYADDDNIAINHDEIDDALFLNREEVRQLLSKEGVEIKDQWAHGPRPSAIANYLLQYWLENQNL